MARYSLVFIGTDWHRLNIDDFNDYEQDLQILSTDTVVSFQTSDLVRYYQTKNKRLPSIIDMESFDKQMSQEGKEFREYKDWHILRALKYHKIIEPDFRLSELTLKHFLESQATLFLLLYDKDADEKERFDTIEEKINALIFKRQLKGIRINREAAKSRCKYLERYIYQIKNTLQLSYRIFTPENIEQQIDYLKSNDYKIIESPVYTFKVHKKNDVVCNLFYELHRSQQDLESLLFICAHWGGAERTFPSFLGFGTITSRIVLRQPALQNLRRTNRDIILPDADMQLLYPDYSQFEAGILASLSNDERLIKLYSSDIYSDIAEKVYDDPTQRSDAKITFYRYMYGDTSLSSKEKAYFNRFTGVQEFRKKIEADAKSSSKVGTENGNYRFLYDSDDFSWALSHVIQGHASLIYKNALLRVRNELRRVEFLIPMHDATLYQVPIDDYTKCKGLIETIYVEEFKKICPQIQPKINFDNFFKPPL